MGHRSVARGRGNGLRAAGRDLDELVREPRNVIRATWDDPISKLYPTVGQSRLGGRRLIINQGVVRGGSGSVNGMIYIRGNRRDYETWTQLGNDGWSYQELLPLFKKSEAFDPGGVPYATRDLDYHGTTGALPVRPIPRPTAAAQTFIEAAHQVGYGGGNPPGLLSRVRSGHAGPRAWRRPHARSPEDHRARAITAQGSAPFAVSFTASAPIPVPAGSGVELRDFIAATVTTVWHPAGTCAMGRHRQSVVDPELRVYGIEGVRVADASIIPEIPSGNINAVCIMIGEQCAQPVRSGPGPRGISPPAFTGRERPAPPRDRPAPGELDLVRSWCDALRRLAGAAADRLATRHADGARDSRSAGEISPKFVAFLGPAWLAFMASSMRYWTGAAETWAQMLPALVQVARNDPGAPSALIEVLRTGLRDLADLPAEESRRLQSHLENLVQRYGAVRPEERDGEYWRRWTVKP